MEKSHTAHHSHGWLDQLAIGMAAVCAVHCLLTPLLVVILPIIATSFFVHQDFHIWMILLVLPTTGIAVFMGCRTHKDKWVALLSGLGLALLVSALIYERVSQGGGSACSHSDGSTCVHNVVANSTNAWAWINSLGGLFLATGHIRNYRMCRKNSCQHD